MNKLLDEFKAFLVKTNAFALAIAVVVGFAVKELVDGIVACFVKPLIDKVLPGDMGQGLTLWVFRVGDFVTIAINFVIIMWVVFMLSKVFIREKKA